MAHDIVFIDGGELSTTPTDKWRATSGITDVGSTFTWKSDFAYRFNKSNATGYLDFGANGLTTAGKWSATTTDSHWISFHMYVAALPGSGQFFWLYRNYRSPVWRDRIRIDENGKISVGQEGSYGTPSTGVLVAGTWYQVSIQRYKGADLRVIVRNPNTEAEVINVVDAAADAGQVAYARIGPSENSYGDFWFDNFVIEVENTEANIDDPFTLLGGNYAVNVLVPDAVGTDDAWTGAYTDVDEIPHNSDTDYRSITAAGIFTNEMQELSAEASAGIAQIEAVQVGVVQKAEGLNSWNGRVRLRSGSTVDETADGGWGDQTAYEVWLKCHEVDPDTAAKWTIAGVDAIEVGANRSTSGASSRWGRITLAWAEVLFKVSAAKSRAFVIA